MKEYLLAMQFDGEHISETYGDIAEVEPEDVTNTTACNIDDIARAILAELGTKVDAIALDKFQM